MGTVKAQAIDNAGKWTHEIYMRGPSWIFFDGSYERTKTKKRIFVMRRITSEGTTERIKLRSWQHAIKNGWMRVIK